MLLLLLLALVVRCCLLLIAAVATRRACGAQNVWQLQLVHDGAQRLGGLGVQRPSDKASGALQVLKAAVLAASLNLVMPTA